MTTSVLLSRIRNGERLSAREQRALILLLSWPSILAQVSVTVMQLIDAGMVGRLGTAASASIGLVASTTWLINGLTSGAVFGFSVQCAQSIGAKNYQQASSLCRQGLAVILLVGFLFGGIGSLLSFHIPVWLGGEPLVLQDAGAYLLIFCIGLPFSLLNSWAIQMLQAAGDTKIPGLVQVLMCILDVLFNALFIYGLHYGVAGAALGTLASVVCASLFLTFWVFRINPFLKLPARLHFSRIYGLHYGVAGAALGTLASVVCASLFLTFWVFRINPFLKLPARLHFSRTSLGRALQIGLPISIEQLITGSSYIAFTRIVSSLGTLAIAANSFAITAESLCYMPAYGCASAATAIIGQCTGAGRKDLCQAMAWRLARIGMGMMVLSGLLLFLFAHGLMAILSPDLQVQDLGSLLLRMEAFAEPMYGASIVITGILRGKGDTLWPACLNFLSIWCIRIPLAWILSRHLGLAGAWIAMNIELNLRGLLFLGRLQHVWPIKKVRPPQNPAGSSRSS